MQRRAPKPKPARFTPAELGFKVTVCIAAICERRTKIVAISDMKISFGGAWSADDVTNKNIALVRDWSVLQAGNNLTDAPRIIDRARERIGNGSAFSAHQVADALHQAYGDRLREQAEAQVLQRYGYTLESFAEKGKTQLRVDG